MNPKARHSSRSVGGSTRGPAGLVEGRAPAGAAMLFVGTVIAPAIVGAAYAALFFQKFGVLDRRIIDAPLMWQAEPVRIAAASSSVLVVVGAYRVTDSGTSGTISDGLRSATRLCSVAYAATLGLLVLTFRTNLSAYLFLHETVAYARAAAEGWLILAAARHLARTGWPNLASAARWLSACTFASVMAAHWLTRPTHDDMFNILPPRYDYVVVPMLVVLWAGRLLIFGALWRALAAGLSKPAHPLRKLSGSIPARSTQR